MKAFQTEHGLVFPEQFLPVAEQYGLIGELTYWVIREVVRQESLWVQAGHSVSISVNISTSDITSLTLPEKFAELWIKNNLDPSRLTLEVTESTLMGKLVTSLDILTRLRLKGIRLSIDDFGTGYSSLSQLHRIPFTELKIDQSFVSNMAEDSVGLSIVKTCIVLGHELNMQVVAEGVESQNQLDLLKSLNCDLAQGYFFSKPLSPDGMTKYLGL